MLNPIIAAHDTEFRYAIRDVMLSLPFDSPQLPWFSKSSFHPSLWSYFRLASHSGILLFVPGQL
jgi:hypothetical protein